VAAAVAGIAVFQSIVTKPGAVVVWSGVEVVTRTPAGTLFMGYLPVVPMTVVSGLLMVVVSMVTRPPGKDVIERYWKP
jgi:hypothetical protein